MSCKEIIKELNKNQSITSMAIDIGISESSLYKYLRGKGVMEDEIINKIECYCHHRKTVDKDEIKR